MNRNRIITVMSVVMVVFFWPLAAWGNPSITGVILYDNYAFRSDVQKEWGFACLIQGTEKTILFDTGRQSDILLRNMATLKITPSAIQIIIVSHNHWDHTGGLYAVLEKKPGIPVYLPASVSGPFIEKIESFKAKAIRVSNPIEICKNVYLTGELGDGIKEQALILVTDKGLVIITGCSHPGIITIVNKAKEALQRDVFMVLGGFHLMDSTEAQIKKIIEGFRKIGVIKVGPTHCTGQKAMDLFKSAYGPNFLKLGAGKTIQFVE